MPHASREDAITVERLERAIVYMAECVIEHGDHFVPFLEKFEAELLALQNQEDPRARARAIVMRARQAESARTSA